MIACSLAPGIVYVLLLLLTGSLADAWLQLVAVGEGKIWRGLTKFISFITMLGFVTGVFATICRKSLRRKMLGVLIVGALLAIMALPVDRQSLALLSFGAAIGVIVTRLYIDRVFLRNLAALVAIGWASSLSIGTPYPVWVSGVLGVAVLMSAANQNLTDPHDMGIGRDTKIINATEKFAVIVVLILSVAVYVNRKNYYNSLENPSWKPTVRLDNKFPGASGLYSSPIMASVYDDLHEFVALARSEGKNYAIVPDFFAWWIAAEQGNPLPVDWMNPEELGHNNPDLVSRLLAAADAQKSDTFFIIQKFESPRISPIAPKIQTWVKKPDYWWEFHLHKIAGHIRMNFELFDENEHFWLYY